ncbi:hypothetical protein [Aliiglaciecola litoralis]|uniref:Uncharacterized protein n=1 Tax=Aliiglaciecola litoralis TaxID=582857 RepID=A0ABP3WR43_9ALTE
MKNAFTCSVSENVLKVDFDDRWDHVRHYQSLFNATGEIARSCLANKKWALLINWRQQLIQIPEEERICVRTVNRHVLLGLHTVVNVIDPHPITQWQLDKVASSNPAINAQIFEQTDEALAWLFEQGFDTKLKEVDFDINWLSPSEDFKRALDQLGLDQERFIET